MSKSEKIKSFNEVLESLLQQFSPIIGTSYHYYFKQYVRANAIDPIKYFWHYAEDLEDKILKRDEICSICNINYCKCDKPIFVKNEYKRTICNCCKKWKCICVRITHFFKK